MTPTNTNENTNKSAHTDIKEIAMLVRDDIAVAIKSGALPAVKVSVRLKRFSGGRSLRVDVKSVPEGFVISNPARVRWEAENPHLVAAFHGPEEVRSRYTNEAEQLLKTIEQIVGAYNWDESDSQSDYFHVNFYQHVGFDWQLENGQRDTLRTTR